MVRSILIQRPTTHRIGDAKYQQECQTALESSVAKLISLATAAGWDQQQVVYAVMCIAALNLEDSTLLAIEAKPAFAAQLDDAE